MLPDSRQRLSSFRIGCQATRQRAAFLKVADSDVFTLNLKVGNVAKRSELMKARTGKDADIMFARGTPVVRDGVLVGADVTIDTAAIAVHPSDKTGVVTLGHELDHITRALDAKLSGAGFVKAWQAALQGDLPDSATGPSAQAGEAVFGEEPDITVKEAEKILERYFAHDD